MLAVEEEVAEGVGRGEEGEQGGEGGEEGAGEVVVLWDESREERE